MSPEVVAVMIATKFIQSRGNGFLYHFTSVENLPLIRELGGLYSKDALNRMGQWSKVSPGGDELSHRLDLERGNWSFVPLNLSHATPMAYRKKRERHLCIFELNPCIACGDGVLFTNTNSTSNECVKAPGYEGLCLIDWEVLNKVPGRDVEWKRWKKSVQAEVLVPEKIPLSKVERIVFVSEASRREGLRLWGESTQSGFSTDKKFAVDETLFWDEPATDRLIKSIDSSNDENESRALYIDFPFPTRIWLKDDSRDIVPKICHVCMENVKLVVEMHLWSPGMHKEWRGSRPTLKCRTTWSDQYGGSKIERVQEFDAKGTMRVNLAHVEFCVPVEQLSDGPCSVNVFVCYPQINSKAEWVRWATLDFEIKGSNSLQSRFRGALILGAVGDALGWPTEFLNPKLKARSEFALPILNFVRWDKIVGGKWWGYCDTIGEGEYSDDTQLTLAVARSISAEGHFMSPHFSYAELPLWLQYERGGGRAIKAAAKWLHQRQPDWHNNFFGQGDLDYRMAGANGAAMRNLPISLALHACESRLIRESIFQAIITHGHPRGILGAVLAAISATLALNGVKSTDKFIDRLHGGLAHAYGKFEKDELPEGWLQTWDERRLPGEADFLSQLRSAKEEADEFLDIIPEFIGKETKEYYGKIGALDRNTKGSGTGTVCSAIYLFLKMPDHPIECLRMAVNLLGSDTDTIASILGGLLGARHGIEIVPSIWLDKIQDRECLVATADKLCCIASGDCSADAHFLGKDEALAKISEWEERYFCRMFSGEIGVGDGIEHPTLGPGKIVDVVEREVPQRGYVAKLIRVEFNCGQSCVFHSRIGPKGQLSVSLIEMLK